MTEALPRETGSEKSSAECGSCGKSLPVVSTAYGSSVAGACPACTKGGQLEAQKALADAEAERGYPIGEPSEGWKVEQLQAYAEEKNVDLAGASRKSEIVQALTER